MGKELSGEVAMKRYVGLQLLLVLGMLPGFARAQTVDTNNPEIVVKSVYCVAFDLSGVLVNRGGQEFHGTLNVAVRDEEGDIVGRNKIKLRVGPENGKRFAFYYINTMNCRRHTFEFKVDPDLPGLALK
jgi:hypothetical protein